MLTQGGAPDVGLEDGAKAVAMGLAAQISAQEGRVVHFDEINRAFTPQFVTKLT